MHSKSNAVKSRTIPNRSSSTTNNPRLHTNMLRCNRNQNGNTREPSHNMSGRRYNMPRRNGNQNGSTREPSHNMSIRRHNMPRRGTLSGMLNHSALSIGNHTAQRRRFAFRGAHGSDTVHNTGNQIIAPGNSAVVIAATAFRIIVSTDTLGRVMVSA
jgi:hypothetical protein